MKPPSSRQFAAFRIAFGVYLAVYVAALLPYGVEIFSADSLFVVRSGNLPLQWLPPSLLALWGGAGVVQVLLGVLLVAAVALACGRGRRIAAVVLWYGMTILVNRNPSVMNPSHAYVGWLCLACALVPPGEAWVLGRPARADWRMPRELFVGAWIVTAVSYTASGLGKLESFEWVDGSAMRYVMGMAYAREWWLQQLLLALPWPAVTLLTWLSLAGELLFAPLSLFAFTRRLVWLVMVGMHLFLLLLMSFPELTLGMLLVHLFLFEPTWIDGLQSRASSQPGPPARHVDSRKRRRRK